MRRNDTILLGVCLWLATRFNLDLFGLRLAFIIVTIISVGSALILYLILALIKPKEKSMY